MTSSARLTAVAPPGSLYTYLSCMHAFVDERPIEDDVIRALIGTARFGPDDSAEFNAGRAELLNLAPPIDATTIADAKLSWMAARSLAFAIVLRAKHVAAWARMKPNSPETDAMLREVAEILNLLRLSMEGAPEAGSWVLTRRLDGVEAELQQFGVKDAGRAVERKGEQRRRLSQPAAATPTSSGLHRVPVEVVLDAREALAGGGSRLRIAALSFVALLGAAWLGYRTLTTDPPPPPASSYKEVPVVALIRRDREVTVRLKDDFLSKPVSARNPGLVALHKRLDGERKGGVSTLILQDSRGKAAGRVVAGVVTWSH